MVAALLIRAGTAPFLRLGAQPGFHRVIFNVGLGSSKLDNISHPMVERFVLPERLAAAAELRVRFPGRYSFDSRHEFGQGHVRLKQCVDVIWHDHVSMQYVVPQLCAALDCVLDDAGDFRICQPQWTARSRIQDPLGAQKLRARLMAPLAEMSSKTIWKGTMQTPGQKYAYCLGLPMRQISPIEVNCHH